MSTTLEISSERLPLSSAVLENLSNRSTLQAWQKKLGEKFFTLGLPEATEDPWRFTKPDQFPWKQLTDEADINISVKGGAGQFEFSETIPGEVLDCLVTGELTSEKTSLFQAAVLQKTAYIKVPKGTTVSEIVTLTTTVQYSGATLIVIQLEAGASMTMVEELTSERAGFLAPRIEFLIGPNASLRFGSLQLLGGNVQYLGKHRAFLSRDSKFDFLNLSLGASVSRTEIDVCLKESNAEATIRGAYIADGSRHVDFHTNQDHQAPHCRSDLLIKGALNHESRAVFYGFIRVAESAQKTDAYQTSRNLLLSPDARADSIPNLEIKANDVKCSHGASVGQVSEVEKFYLMTRGLTKEQAEFLLVEGFLKEVVLAFPVAEVAEGWAPLIEKRLSSSLRKK